MPTRCCCGARRRGDGTCGTVRCVSFRLSGRGGNLRTAQTPKIRLRGKQSVKNSSNFLPVHHSKSKVRHLNVRPAVRRDEQALAHPSAGTDDPELSSPSCQTVATVGSELRAKVLEDLLVGMFGAPTFFRILAVALSWSEQCACVQTMPVKVCAAALLLTGINFEGASPLRPCVPIAHLADHFQVRRTAIVQSMALLCSGYRKLRHSDGPAQHPSARIS
jgi:hypothetical protein